MTQTWEVFRFELGYQLSRISTRIYFALVFSFAIAVAAVFLLDARRDGYFFNSPLIIGAVTIMTSMGALLVMAAVAGDAATRDAQSRIDSLLYTTPLRKAAYLAGRFLGAFCVTALLLVAVPLGLGLAERLPFIERAILGPFRADAYLTSYLVFAVGNAFVATAVLFALAAMTRRAAVAYAGAAALFVSAFVSESFVASRFNQWWLAKLLDPLGFTTLLEVWRASNPIQRNTLLIGVDQGMLANRLLWLSIALVTLTIAFVRFRFAHATGDSGRSSTTIDAPATRWTGITVPDARRVFGAATRLRQLLDVTLTSFRQLITSRGWLIAPFTAVLFILTAPELLEVQLGTPGAATTARVAAIYGAPELARLIVLLITIAAAGLVWRERDARIDALSDVTPVPEWLTFLGKFLSLGLMLAAVEAVFLVAGVIVQAMAGFPRFELGLYFKILFGFQFIGFLLFAALAMVLHVLINQKHVSIVVSMLAYIGLDVARELGIRHNLLLCGGTPQWKYSDIAGFGVTVRPWLWFTLYWSGWALLFAIVAYLFWPRGEGSRVTLARRRLTRGPALTGVLALAVIAGAGGFVFYNTNVLNRFETDGEADARSAEYERRYGHYLSLAQPVLAATKLKVDFYPRTHAATIHGSYLLDNRSGKPIDAIHVVTNPDVKTSGISFDRAAKLKSTDGEFGYRIYTLDQALQPGQSIAMTFDIAYAQRGFTNEGGNSSVMPNGSWIQHRAEQSHGPRQWLPFVGYQTNRELDNAAARSRFGLREKPSVPPLEDLAARQITRGREKIDFEAVVGTDADQLGVTTGALRRTWIENGRRYTHFVADAPISNGYLIYSANYAVSRAKWHGVDLEIFHHPAHTANLDRMIRAAQASLEYNARHFTPYPFRQLRMIEVPSSGTALQLSAHNGAIMFTEGYALVRPGPDPRHIDLPFAVLAHEIGHQWFGHQIVPAITEGAPVLSESLAWYSAMLVVEQALGRDHLNRLLDIMRAEYLQPHETRQVSLLRGFNHLDAYRTGPFAMFALREAVGTERVNTALRNLLAKFDPNRPPYPTSLDLYAELRAVTPPSMHYLLRDLFEDITFWDLRAKSVDVQQAGKTYRVTLHIDAKKLKADATGKEKPVAMNDLIEVAVFDAEGKAIYKQRHPIRSGEQTITIDVARKPARAAIDPDHELLDRKPGDNSADAGP